MPVSRASMRGLERAQEARGIRGATGRGHTQEAGHQGHDEIVDEYATGAITETRARAGWP